MMEAPKGKRKFSCKLCEKSYSSGPALGGHMRFHYTGILNRKTRAAYGNEELEDLTLESEVKDGALALINLKGKLSSGKMELLEIDIPKSGAEEAACKTLSLEMRPKDVTPESKLEEDIALALIDLKLGSRKSELLEIDIPESGAEETACYEKREMMEKPKGEEKFSGKPCEKSYPSGPAPGGHLRCHYSDILNRKTKSAYINTEPEDLTPESELKDFALALINLYEKLGSGKKELLEIDINKSGAEEAERKTLSLEMWHKNGGKIQGTDPALEGKEKIEQAAKPVSKKFVRKRKMTETDVSNLASDLKRTMYECNICHRTFRSHQALGGHLSGRTRGRTCLQEDI